MDDKLPTQEELGVVKNEVTFGSTVYNDGTIGMKRAIEFDTVENMILFWENMAPDEDEIVSMNFHTYVIEIQEYVDFRLFRNQILTYWKKYEEE
mgnify:CR=1 FL=1